MRELFNRYVLWSPQSSLRTQPIMFGIKGLRNRAMLETFFATGIKRDELVKLNIDDIDNNSRLVCVHGKGKKNVWCQSVYEDVSG